MRFLIEFGVSEMAQGVCASARERSPFGVGMMKGLSLSRENVRLWAD